MAKRIQQNTCRDFTNTVPSPNSLEIHDKKQKIGGSMIDLKVDKIDTNRSSIDSTKDLDPMQKTQII